MRLLTTGNKWAAVGEQDIPISSPPKAAILDPVLYGIDGGGLVIRLSDGPGREPRFTNAYSVALSNPWARGTIQTIARSIARLPLNIIDPDVDDKGDDQNTLILPEHTGSAGRIARALRYPNPGLSPHAPRSRRALWFATVSNKMIHGNALWEIVRSGRGEILGFVHHSWDKVDLDENTMIYKVYPHSLDGGLLATSAAREPTKVLTPSQVVHFGLFEDGRRAEAPSPFHALPNTLKLYDAVSRHVTSYFNKGARPSGALEVDQKTGGPARKLIHDEIEKLYSSPENAGNILVTSGKWNSFTESPDHSGLVELLKLSRDEIFVTYGVPPPIMGILDRAIMSNVREMRDQFIRDLIGSHTEFFAGDFESQVVDEDKKLVKNGVYAKFGIDEQLRRPLEDRAKTFRDAGVVYTLNEQRKMDNLPRIEHEWADIPWRGLNEAALTSHPDQAEKQEFEQEQAEKEPEVEETPEELAALAELLREDEDE